MEIVLVNPPNCGRSIPEERYGIDSLKQIFRGEPLGLEELAGNLAGHDVRILDLKVPGESLETAFAEGQPDVVGFTGMTCEANGVLKLARQAKEASGATVVVGGVHASADPEYFNRPEVDFVCVGPGKASFRELVDALSAGEISPTVPGTARTHAGRSLVLEHRSVGLADLVERCAPRYDLVHHCRPHYRLASLDVELGFVASSSGCPHRCSFCSIAPVSGGRYLSRAPATVVRDMRLLGDVPWVRLVDANSFGDPAAARDLAQALGAAGLGKNLLADARADTVVAHPELFALWKSVGLRAVVIGFEEIGDAGLVQLNKGCVARCNTEALAILKQLGIAVVGDFILSPDYTEEDFDRLAAHLMQHPVDLPMFTVLTPLPGTPLYRQLQGRIAIHDLDYYTLTNAVLPTTLPPERFYQRYAELLRVGHANARL